MAMTREEAVRKVQAALRLSKSTENPAEAATAVGRARAIMDAYAISEEALVETELVHKQVMNKRKRTVEVDIAATMCVKYFNVKVMGHPTLGWVYLLGRLQHVEIAEHVFFYLYKTIRLNWLRFRRTTKRPGFRQSFMLGMAEGIDMRLCDERRRDRAAGGHGSELAVCDWRVQEELRVATENMPLLPPQEELKPAGKQEEYSNSAAIVGFLRGKDVQVRKGLR